MDTSFLGKVKSHWNKGWNQNPSFEKAKNYINVMAKGKNEKELSKGKESREAEELLL